jgi:hypothetical protein
MKILALNTIGKQAESTPDAHFEPRSHEGVDFFIKEKPDPAQLHLISKAYYTKHAEKCTLKFIGSG